MIGLVIAYSQIEASVRTCSCSLASLTAVAVVKIASTLYFPFAATGTLLLSSQPLMRASEGRVVIKKCLLQRCFVFSVSSLLVQLENSRWAASSPRRAHRRSQGRLHYTQ